jgi:selenocysteine-specific elongation factor
MGPNAVMIVGTAGHIDHGKTTLVRALTGVDTDRLKEEKARGISIELGYAYTPLPNGDVLGFVDVPGHERLVHTMASGACGIDFALLVVAADDGPMPQTREHVAILRLFGVARGAVAITKVDRVDEGRVQAVEADVRALLAPTVFAGAPMFRVNAVNEGDDGTRLLKEHLRQTAASPSRKTADDARLFRLAVDRVFTLAGHGTVVAGTVFSGTVRVGDRIVALPSNRPVRVRSIHAQNRPAEVGHSGERCAVALSGIEKNDIKRGDWLADAQLLVPTTRIDVRLEWLASGGHSASCGGGAGSADRTGADARDSAGHNACTGGDRAAIKSGLPVHFHHGAAHLTARLIPLSDPADRPGPSYHHAQLVFDTPVCGVPGDRFVLRDAQALHTLGGGVVLDPYAPARKRRSPERIRYLHALERMLSGDGLGPLLQETRYGIKHSELIRLCGREAPELPEGAMTVEGVRERHVVLSSTWCDLGEEAVEALRQFHIEWPDEPGPDVGRLRRIGFPQFPDHAWHALIAELTSEGTILRSGPWVYLPGHAVTLSDAERTLAKRLQPLIAAGRFNPPWVRGLAAAVGEPEEPVRHVLRKLVTQGAVYQVVHDLFYDRECVNELATVVARLANEHGAVEAAHYRDALGLGRKRAIQILEFFDRVGHTRRIRDTRVVRADSSWRTA